MNSDSLIKKNKSYILIKSNFERASEYKMKIYSKLGQIGLQCFCYAYHHASFYLKKQRRLLTNIEDQEFLAEENQCVSHLSSNLDIPLSQYCSTEETDNPSASEDVRIISELIIRYATQSESLMLEVNEEFYNTFQTALFGDPNDDHDIIFLVRNDYTKDVKKVVNKIDIDRPDLNESTHYTSICYQRNTKTFSIMETLDIPVKGMALTCHLLIRWFNFIRTGFSEIDLYIKKVICEKPDFILREKLDWVSNTVRFHNYSRAYESITEDVSATNRAYNTLVADYFSLSRERVSAIISAMPNTTNILTEDIKNIDKEFEKNSEEKNVRIKLPRFDKKIINKEESKIDIQIDELTTSIPGFAYKYLLDSTTSSKEDMRESLNKIRDEVKTIKNNMSSEVFEMFEENVPIILLNNIDLEKLCLINNRNNEIRRIRWAESHINYTIKNDERHRELGNMKLYYTEFRHHTFRQEVILNEIKTASINRIESLIEPDFKIIIDSIKKHFGRENHILSQKDSKYLNEIFKYTPDEYYIKTINNIDVPVIREYQAVNKFEGVERSINSKLEAYSERIFEINRIFSIYIIYEIYIYCSENEKLYINNNTTCRPFRSKLLSIINNKINSIDAEAKREKLEAKYNAYVQSMLIKEIKLSTNTMSPIFIPEFGYLREGKSAYTEFQMQREKTILSYINEEEKFNTDNIKHNFKYVDKKDFSTNRKLEELLYKNIIDVFDKKLLVPPRCTIKVIEDGFNKLKEDYKTSFKIRESYKRSLIFPLDDDSFSYNFDDILVKLSKLDVIDDRSKYINFIAKEYESLNNETKDLFRNGLSKENDEKVRRQMFKSFDITAKLLSSQTLKLNSEFKTLGFCDEYKHDDKPKVFYNSEANKKEGILIDDDKFAKINILFNHFKEKCFTPRIDELNKSYYTTDMYLKEFQKISISHIDKFLENIFDRRGLKYADKVSKLSDSIRVHANRRIFSDEITFFNKGLKNIMIFMAEGDSLLRVQESRPICIVSIISKKVLDIMLESECFLKFNYYESEIENEFIIITNWFRLDSYRLELHNDSIIKVLSGSYNRYMNNIDNMSNNFNSLLNYTNHLILYTLSSSSRLCAILKEFQHCGLNARSLRSETFKYITSKLLINCKSTVEVYALHKVKKFMIDCKNASNKKLNLYDPEMNVEKYDLSDELDKNSRVYIDVISHLSDEVLNNFPDFLNDIYIVHVTMRETTQGSHIKQAGVSQLAIYNSKFIDSVNDDSIRYANSLKPLEFDANLKALSNPNMMFGYNSYCMAKGIRILIEKYFQKNEKEIKLAISGSRLFDGLIHRHISTKGLVSEFKNTYKSIDEIDLKDFDELFRDESIKHEVNGKIKVDIKEYQREKVVVHILRIMKENPNMTTGELIKSLNDKGYTNQIFEMHYRNQFGPDREMYIQNLLTKLNNNIIETVFTTLCNYIPTEFQTISGKKKNIYMQKQNLECYRYLNEQKEINPNKDYKIYFLNGDSTKWSLSDIIETCIICVEECEEYIGEDLANFCMANLKFCKQKCLRLTRDEQIILNDIIGGEKPLNSDGVKEVIKYLSEDCRNLITQVGWFQGIYNKLSGFKHAASNELFQEILKELVKRKVLSELMVLQILHSDDYNCVICCVNEDILKIWALNRYVKAMFNIKDSTRKTNLNDIIREFISDYYANLRSEEPIFKYIMSLSFTTSMNGYDADITEGLSKITNATDRGSCSMFDDFLIRLNNYIVSTVYSMRKGMRNDPSTIFKIDRDLLPIELGGELYEESNALTICGAAASNVRILTNPESLELSIRLISVFQIILSDKDNENYRDDLIHTRALFAITSTYSKVIQSVRKEFPLTEKMKEKRENEQMSLKSLTMPDEPSLRYDYLIEKLHTVSYSKAFELSDNAKSVLKQVITVGGKVISLGSERLSYRDAFVLTDNLLSKTKLDNTVTKERITNMYMLSNSMKVNWLKLRSKMKMPRFIENPLPLKYQEVKKFVTSLNLHNDVSKLIMHAKYGEQYIMDNGFKMKNQSSIDTDILQIESILGKNFREYAELELYKVINGLTKSKTIIRTGSNIKSFTDFIYSMYSFNIYPMKMPLKEDSEFNKDLTRNVKYMHMNSDELHKSVITRMCNYINARVINRDGEEGAILTELLKFNKIELNIVSIFKAMSLDDFKRKFNYEDLILISLTFDRIGIVNFELSKYINKLEYSSRINMKRKGFDTNELKQYLDSTKNRLKRTQESKPKWLDLDDSDITTNNSIKVVEVKFSFFRLEIIKIYNNLMMKLHVPEDVEAINKTQLNHMIDNGISTMMKSFNPREGSFISQYISGKFDEIKTSSTWETSLKSNLYISQSSYSFIEKKSHLSYIPFIKVYKVYKSELSLNINYETEIEFNKEETELYDDGKQTVDYRKGNRLCAVRFIDDRGCIKLDYELNYNGINFMNTDLRKIKENITTNLFDKLEFTHEPESYSEIEKLCNELNIYLASNLDDNYNFGELVLDLEEMLDVLKENTDKIVKNKIESIKKKLSKLDDNSSTSGSLTNRDSVIDKDDFMSYFGNIDFKTLLDNMEIVEDVKISDELDLDKFIYNAKTFDSSFDKVTKRKFIYMVTGKGFLEKTIRSKFLNYNKNKKLTSADFKFLKSIINQLKVSDNYSDQNIVLRVFLKFVSNDISKILKEGKRIDYRSFLNDELDQYNTKKSRFRIEILNSWFVKKGSEEFEFSEEEESDNDESIADSIESWPSRW